MKIRCDDCPSEAVTVVLVGNKPKPVQIMLCALCREVHQLPNSFNEVTVADFLKFIQGG
jgi:hypothetical protein